MGVRCGAICLIALFAALSDWESNQERGASKQLAPGVPYTHLQPALGKSYAAYRRGANKQLAPCPITPAPALTAPIGQALH